MRIWSQHPASSQLAGTLLIGLAVVVIMSATVNADAQVDKKVDPGRHVATTASADIGARTFNQGKDLIAAHDWDAAAEKFRLIIDRYSKSRYYEPAMYWLAYVRQRQRKYQEAFSLTNKFLDQFPQSTWKEDVRSLRVELAAQVGNAEIIAKELQNANSDEIRLAALSSLLRLDGEKGFNQAADILHAPSNAGKRNLRVGIVRLIGEYGGNEAATVLLGIALNKSEQEVIRTGAIFGLRRHVNKSVLEQLIELVMKGDAPAVVEAALFIFLQQGNQWAKELLLRIVAEGDSPDTRRRTVHFLVKLKGGIPIDELTTLYEASADVGVKREILSTLSKTNNLSAQSRVFEISRGTDNTGLREEGLLSLGRHGSQQIIEQVIQLYDAETREEVKLLILSSLSKSKHKNAQAKLANVAQTDLSLRLRRRAQALLTHRTTSP